MRVEVLFRSFAAVWLSIGLWSGCRPAPGPAVHLQDVAVGDHDLTVSGADDTRTAGQAADDALAGAQPVSPDGDGGPLGGLADGGGPAGADSASADVGASDAGSLDAQAADIAPPCVDAKITHILHVAADGMQAKGLGSLIAAGKAPNFKRMVDEGTTTLNARCDYTHSITLPNMSCMLTGRSVSAVSGKAPTVFHGYVDNIDVAVGVTLHNAGNPALSYVPGIFDVVHDHGMRTGMYVSKTKFSLFDQSWDAAAGAPDLVGADNGQDKIDVFVLNEDTAALTDAFIAASSKQPFDYAFVHLRDADAIGHQEGWGSAKWQEAVVHVDKQLGKLLDHVEQHPALKGHTVVIVAADHGGHQNNHAFAWHPDVFTIPFMVWGARIGKGLNAYDRFANRFDPLEVRTDYTVAAQPLRNGDAANLAASLLGLPNVSGSLMIDAGLVLTSCQD